MRDLGVPVSIVIPCFNEAKRIEETIRQANQHISLFEEDEIIFVDDCSVDNTNELLSAHVGERFRVVKNQVNEGKWGAIRKGVLSSKNNFIVFLDADLSVGFEFVDACRPMGLNEVMYIGDRYMSKTSKIPFKRFVFSRLFNMFTRVLVGLDLNDTQCPAKAFAKNGASLKAISSMVETRYVGDVEFLVRMSELGFDAIPMPVTYIYREHGDFSVKRHSLKMLAGLLRIRKQSKENIAHSTYSAEQKTI